MLNTIVSGERVESVAWRGARARGAKSAKKCEKCEAQGGGAATGENRRIAM